MKTLLSSILCVLALTTIAQLPSVNPGVYRWACKG